MDERQQAYASLPHTFVTLMSRHSVRFTGMSAQSLERLVSKTK